MTPTPFDFDLHQGTTFVRNFFMQTPDGHPFDLTGYTAVSQMRATYSASNAAATFVTTVVPESGSVSIQLSAAQTAALSARQYVYDIELHKESRVDRLVFGKVTVIPEVTRL